MKFCLSISEKKFLDPVEEDKTITAAVDGVDSRASYDREFLSDMTDMHIDGPRGPSILFTPDDADEFCPADNSRLHRV